jgi:hypothetical protein
MIKILLTIVILSYSLFNQAQAIDSVSVIYNSSTKQLNAHVFGRIIIYDPEAIVSVRNSLQTDTVTIDIDFWPCSVWQTQVSFDTLVDIDLSTLNTGTKILRVRTFRIADIDTICYYSSVDKWIDTAYTPFNIPIGIAEPNLESVICYPNPTNGLLKLEVPDGMEVTYTLYAATGTKILHGICEKSVSLDLSPFTNGLYILELKQGDAFLRHRLTKQ